MKTTSTTDNITVSIEGGEPQSIPRWAYVRAKTKQLREFGYSKLTEGEVDEQITALIEGKKLGEGLTVIGGFMEDEVVVEKKKATYEAVGNDVVMIDTGGHRSVIQPCKSHEKAVKAAAKWQAKEDKANK